MWGNRRSGCARPGMSVSIDADIVRAFLRVLHKVARLVPPRATAKPAVAQSRRRLAPGRFVLVALVVALTAHGDQRMRGIKRSDRARSGCVACRQRASPAGAAPARSHGGRRPQQRWRRRRARTLHLRCERPAELERVEHIDRRRTRPPGARDGGARHRELHRASANQTRPSTLRATFRRQPQPLHRRSRPIPSRPIRTARDHAPWVGHPDRAAYPAAGPPESKGNLHKGGMAGRATASDGWGNWGGWAAWTGGQRFLSEHQASDSGRSGHGSLSPRSGRRHRRDGDRVAGARRASPATRCDQGHVRHPRRQRRGGGEVRA